ncbi:MAG: Fe-S cluster assembly protein SufD [Cytophagales bacterium]|nr:MAG: Fe-S cluster assembly protein SufD [Rhodothermaeota bacterium MED-G16]
MIESLNLEKSISREADKDVRLMKSDTLKNIDKSLKKYKEEYKYTPLFRKTENKIQLDGSELGQDYDLEKIKSLIPKNDDYKIIVIDGLYQEELSSIPKGLLINKYSDLSEDMKAEFQKAYQGFDDSENDVFSSINTINHLECLTIYIEKDVNIKNKISIFNIIQSTHSSYFRKSILIKKSSHVSFSEEFIGSTKEISFSNSVAEIFLHENSKLDYFSCQDFKNNFHFNSINVFQKKDSISNFHTYSFSGATIRNNLNISLKDKNCYANMYGFYAIKNNSHIDNHTTVDHMDENSISNEHYKGIVEGGSRGVFNGKIYVRQKAQKTNAFQSNNNILLSDNAKVNTKPQLEIWADDVKCSHGCTVGQLDEDALFYLMSRGIPKKEATSILLSAFSSDITEKIEDKNLRKHYEELILTQLGSLNYE